ncbi:MAG: hypothetical protein ACFCD0_07255 [Gemmataceae bacterium]
MTLKAVIDLIFEGLPHPSKPEFEWMVDLQYDEGAFPLVPNFG